MTGLTVLAPAKLNLGLEILGKRSDGYHEIATILQAVSIYDRLTLQPAEDLTLTCSVPELAGPSNLALIAARRLREQVAASGASIHLSKVIPAAAGLGGASSDAAATLVAAASLWGMTGAPSTLAAISEELGSDVPFFLTGGAAVATGRGTQLTALPPPDGVWFVVVVPTLLVERKTETMYAAIRPDDVTDGAAIHRQADRLRTGASIEPTFLANAFHRPLLDRFPALRSLCRSMTAAGAPLVALSGAGPAHYTLLPSAEEAAHVAATLNRLLGDSALTYLCRPLAEPCQVVTT